MKPYLLMKIPNVQKIKAFWENDETKKSGVQAQRDVKDRLLEMRKAKENHSLVPEGSHDPAPGSEKVT
jgi:hypothetical protein